eukprot:3143842-Pleurochrysis_carterae.AAC.1
MAAITDLGERNRLATTIPGSHLRVFKVSPIALEMLGDASARLVRRFAGLASYSAGLASHSAWLAERSEWLARASARLPCASVRLA